MPAPYKLGAPKQFTEYREGQDEVILRVAASKARFVVVVAPTGFGKTLFDFVLAKLEGDRAVMLTATRGLQDQVRDVYAEVGLADVRGAGNYPCRFEEFEPEAAAKSARYFGGGELHEYDEPIEAKPRAKPKRARTRMCDDAPCHNGQQCIGKGSGCDYFSAVRRAQLSEIFDTNYSYWMASHAYSGGLGKVGLMLADEAHEIPEELSRHLRVELTARQLERCRRAVRTSPGPRDGLGRWAAWAFDVLSALSIPDPDDAPRWQALGRELRDLGRALHRLREVARESEWAIERGDRSTTFEPVNPAPYAESSLWLGAPKIVLTSATVRPKMLELVGVPDDDYEFIELPSVFDPDRRPVYVVPGPRLSSKAPASAFRDAVRVVDAILGARRDRKSIVHSVSFERAEAIKTESAHGPAMLTFESRTKAAVVAAFKIAGPGAILVGPKLETGYDFPDDECRCQIVFKVPFPDSRGAVMTARQKRWRWYGLYLAMMSLVQAVGRACRSKRDWCENFIIDGNAAWFLAGNKAFAPRSFLEALRWRKRKPTIEDVIRDLPKPMPRKGPSED